MCCDFDNGMCGHMHKVDPTAELRCDLLDAKKNVSGTVGRFANRDVWPTREDILDARAALRSYETALRRLQAKSKQWHKRESSR